MKRRNGKPLDYETIQNKEPSPGKAKASFGGPAEDTEFMKAVKKEFAAREQELEEGTLTLESFVVIDLLEGLVNNGTKSVPALSRFLNINHKQTEKVVNFLVKHKLIKTYYNHRGIRIVSPR